MGDHLVSDDFARWRSPCPCCLAVEGAKWSALLWESRSGRSNIAWGVPHEALQLAQQRVHTVLNPFSPKDDGAGGAELG